MKSFHKGPNRYITQVALQVKDLERSKEFYKHIMGFQMLEENERKAVLSADGIHPLIILTQPEDAISKPPGRTGLYHYALLLPSRLQLGLFLKHVREHDYPMIGGSDHGVSEAIYLQDPDDLGIEIYADIDSSQWKWNDGTIEMTTLPLDGKSLLKEAGDKQWKGMPEGTVIGHIHLHVADLMDGKRFYGEGLGFDPVMEMGGSALFLSTGGYHHHIGLNIWNGEGAAPLPKNAAGLAYYTILFPDDEDRNSAIQRLREGNDRFFKQEGEYYTMDPSGNVIKLMI